MSDVRQAARRTWDAGTVAILGALCYGFVGTVMSATPFSLLVKPAGADCNMRCDYCFYLPKASLYPGDERSRMSLHTVEAMLRAYFATPQEVYAFGWQGGEPTLMGLDFFREVFAMQRRLAPPGARISNGLQTNGTLLSAEWAQTLREHDVLVGLSIDGSRHIHDRYRVWADRDGPSAGTHRYVEATARMLREEKVAFNALTVVGRHNQERAVEVYEYLRALKIRHMQFIPLVEWENVSGADLYEPPETPLRLSPFSVTGEGWARFLTAILERWFPKDVRRVSIRHHDSIMELLVNGRYNVCTTSGRCGGHFVVEHTGDIYPCDFFVEASTRLGNVRDDPAPASSEHGEGAVNPFLNALQDPRHHAFVAAKAHWNETCTACEYLWLCGGDCPKLRLPRRRYATDTTPTRDDVSALCEGWKSFYRHSLSRFENLARSIAPQITGRPPAMPALMERWDSGRECFCGSGRPAGKCHLAGRG